MVFIRLLSILFEKARRLRGKADGGRRNQTADELAEELSHHILTQMSMLLACAKL